MEIKVTYIANDGEEFDTEEECREYERRCDPGDSLVMFNSLQDYAVVKDSDPINGFDHSDIFYIKDAKRASDFFQFVKDQSGYNIPEKIRKGGIYIYNSSFDGYDDLYAELKRLNDIRKKVTSAVVEREVEF